MQPALKAHKVLRALKVLQVQVEPVVFKVLKALKVEVVLKVLRAHKVLQEHLV